MGEGPSGGQPVVIEKIYVEGGAGQSDAAARQSFAKFLADPNKKRSPAIIICGSRGVAIRQFQKNPSLDTALLIDAEGPVHKLGVVEHLRERGDLDRPSAQQMKSSGKHSRVFLMVETMENWMIADMEAIERKHETVQTKPATDCLKRHGGDAEKIDKKTAEEVVTKCLRGIKNKGKRMELIGLLNPDEVRRHCAELDRLLNMLYA